MSKINIVVATHGNFGLELVKSAEMIIGKTEHVYNLSLQPNMSFEYFSKAAKDLLFSIEGPILTLVDLFGGTPSNVMGSLTKDFNEVVIAGVNLPIFLSLYSNLLNNQFTSLNGLAETCKKIGCESVVEVGGKCRKK